MSNGRPWEKIFRDYNVLQHDFSVAPFAITAEQIKASCQNFTTTSEKEVRILCKQDCREDRPDVFAENGLFILPVKNGYYNIVKGEGYIDIPNIDEEIVVYSSKLDFPLDTSVVGHSEMQHLDYAYAVSLIRTFTNDPSLVLTIRGRKFTPTFDFRVNQQTISVSGVQTEVDAGYEGRGQVVLIEAKASAARNTIIRQLYYPFRQWQSYTQKKVVTLFFEKAYGENVYSLWQFEFTNPNDYNSITLSRSGKYRIV